jgi:hypothetical protein
LRRFGERERWCTDTQEAMTAEIAAALTIAHAECFVSARHMLGGNKLRDGEFHRHM